MAKQGDIYWLQLDAISAHPHPHVVMQIESDMLTLCAVTTNRKKIGLPGNLLLDIGEANLPKQSIVDVGQVVDVDRSALGEYIGTLNETRIQEIRAGMRFVERMSAKKE